MPVGRLNFFFEALCRCGRSLRRLTGVHCIAFCGLARVNISNRCHQPASNCRPASWKAGAACRAEHEQWALSNARSYVPGVSLAVLPGPTHKTSGRRVVNSIPQTGRAAERIPATTLHNEAMPPVASHQEVHTMFPWCMMQRLRSVPPSQGSSAPSCGSPPASPQKARTGSSDSLSLSLQQRPRRAAHELGPGRQLPPPPLLCFHTSSDHQIKLGGGGGHPGRGERQPTHPVRATPATLVAYVRSAAAATAPAGPRRAPRRARPCLSRPAAQPPIGARCLRLMAGGPWRHI